MEGRRERRRGEHGLREDPLDTVHRAVSDGEFDELIVCTTPAHLARWVHHDLPHRLQHLGLPGLGDLAGER